MNPEEVLNFWFADACDDPAAATERRSFWFEASSATDEDISRRFSSAVERAGRGELAHWERTPRGAVALVVLLDQFPRNLGRGTAKAFQWDSHALEIALRGAGSFLLEKLSPVEQCTFVLPYEHSEDLSVQRAGIELLEQLIDAAAPEWKAFVRTSLVFARHHIEIIEEFGRFPHRNAVLARVSTAAELRYLTEGGESFGQ